MHFRWQVVSCEEDCHIVIVENSLKIGIEQSQISLGFQRHRFDEKHGVLKFLDVWVVACLPSDFNGLLRCLRSNEAHVWLNVDRNWSRSVHKEGHRRMFQRISQLKHCEDVAFLMHLEDKLIVRLDVDKAGANINCALESECVGAIVFLVTRLFGFLVAIVALILILI